jgi:type IV pilus assembly protein PilE
MTLPQTLATPARRSRTTRGRQAGFTLIELMVVVAIVAILAVIAVASYDFAVVKTRRATAEGCLQERAQFMERFYTTNLRYDQDLGGTAVTMPAQACVTELNGFYTFQFIAGEPTQTTFAIQAVPTAAQNDGKCATLSLDQIGTKGVTGSGTVDDCW